MTSMEDLQSSSSKTNSRIYEVLRAMLLKGQLAPGTAIGFRQIAEQLSTSVMPVREAVHRLVAEGALEIRPNRRLYIPEMTQHRFEQLMRARILLEPDAARQALPHIDSALLKRIRLEDEIIGEALETKNFANYMTGNYQFHFLIYRASHSRVFVNLIESIWLQFAPYMRWVYENYGGSDLADQHQAACEAISARDEQRLMQAIREDIIDGMSLLGSGVLHNQQRT
ncbi:MAG TPA: GntR family transcriptional regulator [Steroidobacteraceae bacterium]